MSKKIFHCIYCSSEEENYAFNNILSRTGIRWISKPHPQYPIEAVINLNGDFLLDGIQIINHESMISSHVDIFVSNSCFSGKVEIDETNYNYYKKDFNWNYLGYFNFNSNEKSQWSAREFIQLKFERVQVSYIKFMFLECYPTYVINPDQRVSIISIHFSGNFLHRLKIGSSLLELYNDLNRSKTFAIDQENYPDAAYFSTQLQNIRENAELLKQFYEQKNEAMEKEEYLTVDSLVNQIRSIVNHSLYIENDESLQDKLSVRSTFQQSETPFEQNEEEDSQEMHSIPQNTTSQPENTDSMPDAVQQNDQETIESVDFIDDSENVTTNKNEDNDITEETNEEDQMEPQNQDTKNEESFDTEEDMIEKSDNKEAAVLADNPFQLKKEISKPKEVKKAPSQEFEDKMKSLASQPDAVNPLSEDASNEASYLIYLFGEEAVAPVYSNGWTVKSKGFEDLVEKIIDLAHPDVQNQALQNMLPIIQGMFSSNLKAVYSIGVNKTIYLFDEMKYNNPSTFKSLITHRFIQLLLSFSIPKLSNKNPGIHDAALTFTEWVIENDKLCMNELLRFVFQPLPSANSMILLKSKLKILNRIIEEHEKSVTDKLELDKLMKFILPNIESTNQDVRNAAFELYATSYCYYGALMEKYIKNKPQRLKNQIYSVIGLPST